MQSLCPTLILVALLLINVPHISAIPLSQTTTAPAALQNTALLRSVNLNLTPSPSPATLTPRPAAGFTATVPSNAPHANLSGLALAAQTSGAPNINLPNPFTGSCPFGPGNCHPFLSPLGSVQGVAGTQQGAQGFAADSGATASQGDAAPPPAAPGLAAPNMPSSAIGDGTPLQPSVDASPPTVSAAAAALGTAQINVPGGTIPAPATVSASPAADGSAATAALPPTDTSGVVGSSADANAGQLATDNAVLGASV